MAETDRRLPREAAADNTLSDIPDIAEALQANPQDRVDTHLGLGVAFSLGNEQPVQLELYQDVLRLSLPEGQLAIPRTPAEISPEGVAFSRPDSFFLSVGQTGEILFQYSPRSEAIPQETPEQVPAVPSPAPPSRTKEKSPPSEKYIGRMGEVKTHWTKAGKLVAEVEITVNDPQRPGSSKLVKFAAFDRMAEALQREYRPGQQVTAVGIPHELKRRTRDGQEYIERQLYFVQPPTLRGGD